jgi:hypothetical protein
MKIQKPGKAVGDCSTPLKVSIILKRSVAMLPAVSASGMAAIIMCANVETNIIWNDQPNQYVWMSTTGAFVTAQMRGTHELNDKKEHQPSRFVVLILSENREIPGNPHQDPQDDLIR